jgi:hypothetical protein
MSRADSTRCCLAQYMNSIESPSVEFLAPQRAMAGLCLMQQHENISHPLQVLGVGLIRCIIPKGCPKIHPLPLYMKIGFLYNNKIHISSLSMMVKKRFCTTSSLKALHSPPPKFIVVLDNIHKVCCLQIFDQTLYPLYN